MSKLKKLFVGLVVLVALGAIAREYNIYNHHKMAVEKCGSEKKVQHVDSKGFECVSTATE